MPSVIQAIKPYFSPSDIEKGAQWSKEISQQLEKTDVGLIILTRSNLNAPWVMFEAGSLAKKLEKARVCPILIGVDEAEIKGPLTIFQNTKFTQNDMFDLLKTLNTALGQDQLEMGVLATVFNKWWPDLKAAVEQIPVDKQDGKETKPRSLPDMVEEILITVRSLKQDPDQYKAVKKGSEEWGTIAPEPSLAGLRPHRIMSAWSVVAKALQKGNPELSAAMSVSRVLKVEDNEVLVGVRSMDALKTLKNSRLDIENAYHKIGMEVELHFASLVPPTTE